MDTLIDKDHISNIYVLENFNISYIKFVTYILFHSCEISILIELGYFSLVHCYMHDMLAIYPRRIHVRSLRMDSWDMNSRGISVLNEHKCCWTKHHNKLFNKLMIIRAT